MELLKKRGVGLRLNRHGLVVLLLIALMAFLHGCGDSPNGPEIEMIEKPITPTDGNEPLTDATLYDEETDDVLGTGATTLEREKDTELVIRVEADGFISTTQTVSFQNESSVEIAVSADKVTIDYRIADTNDELISGAELLMADTLASSGPEGSITLPYQDRSVEICARAEYYEEACEEIALDENQDLTLESARKRVTYTITPEIEGYEDYSEALTYPPSVRHHTAYKLTIGDSTWVTAGKNADIDGSDNTATSPEIAEGVTTKVEYPMGADPVEVFIRAQYFPKEGHAYSASDNNYLNVAENTMSVSSDADKEVNISLAHIPACSDGVNNDVTDGIDEADPGCMDESGNYDPQDDVELLHVQGISYGSQTDEGEVILVSGSNEEREVDYIKSRERLPSSIQAAISIDLEIPTRVSESQTGEEFALRFFIGPNEDNLNDVYTTNIIEDDGSDGWTYREINNINPDWFSDHRNYKTQVIHATKVRGEDSTDGNDDVILVDSDETRGTTLTWTFPPEDVDDNQQKRSTRKTTSAKVKDKQ